MEDTAKASKVGKMSGIGLIAPLAKVRRRRRLLVVIHRQQVFEIVVVVIIAASMATPSDEP